MDCLPQYIMFLNMHAPGSCWGSSDKVMAWRLSGGLVAERKRQMNLAFYNDALAAEDAAVARIKIGADQYNDALGAQDAMDRMEDKT